MTSSALIAHVLDPLVPPGYADQELFYDKAFSNGDDRFQREYVRGFKRVSTETIDWAGDKLLVTDKNCTMHLFDVERDEELRSWPGEWMAAQVDPNNPHLAAAIAWSGKFRVLDTRSSSQVVFDVELKKQVPSMKEFLCLAWSPSSGHIALANRADNVYLLDLRVQGTLRLGVSRSIPQEVNQIAWSQDGDSLWLATGGTPGKLHVFPAPSLEQEGAVQLVGHQSAAISLAADPTGRQMACGGADCLVSLWDPKHLVCTRALPYATQMVTSLSYNHTGDLLAWGTGGTGSTSTGERNLTIVGANTGSLYWQDSTIAPVTQVKWHPKRNVLAYTLLASQLPDDRDLRDRGMGGRGRDCAVVHTLKVPDIP